MTARPRRPALRVLATNDLCASTDPTPTSFGHLPGYHGLRRCAQQLKDAQPSVWIDAGDFAQGGPLAPLTGGRGGFEAAATLPIDAAVAGNHEFDWGTAHLQAHQDLLPFPLLAANTGGLLPGRAVISAGPVAVGVAGLTYPEPGLLPAGVLNHAQHTAEVMLAACRALRAGGADIAVAAIHQGAPFNATRTTPAPGRQLRAVCKALAGTADLLIGGHTLARYLRTLHGVPYLQPYSYGYEIGVCDLAPGGGHRLHTARPGRGTAWDGYGAHLTGAASTQVIGHLPDALRSVPGRDRSLPDWIAFCLAHAAATPAALFPGDTLIMQQPPIGGVAGYLPAGPVTRASRLRLYPWADDDTIILDCAGLDLHRLAAALGGPWGDCGIYATAPVPAAVCLPAYHLAQAQAWAGTDIAHVPGPCGVRDAITAALAATLPAGPR